MFLVVVILFGGTLLAPGILPAVSASTVGNASPAAPAAGSAAPAATQPFFPNIRVTDGSSQFTDQVEPTMAINKSGTIFVGWKETNGQEAAGLRVGFSYSMDRGATWAPNILMNQSHPNQNCHNSDPWMALGPDDRVQYAYLEYDCNPTGLDLSNTTDGTAWSNVHFMPGGGGLTDKDSIDVDYLGRVYAAWDEGNVLMVSWTDDGGAHWAPFKFPDNAGSMIGAIIKTSPTGVVYLTWWDFSMDDILFTWSSDRGQTWHSPAVRVNDVPGSAQSFGSWDLPMPQMVVDPNSGTIYNIWTDSRGGTEDIYMSRSTNGGQTWSANTRVNDVTTDTQRMPDITIDSTGKLHAAWYDDRTGNHNIFYANSTTGGQSWGTNVKVTTEESSGSLARPGDYFAIRAAPDNSVHVVWTDGRGSDYDIYYARNPGFPAATLTVATNPAGLKVQIDNVTMSSPAQKTVLLGSAHTISAPDPQLLSDTTRYIWTSWSDGGARTHVVVANADLSVVASFKKQFRATSSIVPSGPYILVDNVPYAGAATFWWDQGSAHWLEAPSPQIVSSDTRFVWVSWSDSGAQAHGVTASAPLDVTATFQRENTLVVNTLPANLTFSLDGVPATSPGSFWLALGSTHTVATDTLQSGPPGVRYRFLEWSDGGAASHTITVNGGMSLTARFRSEYYLTVVSPVTGFTGAGWYLEGSTAYATVPTATKDLASGERLSFQGWGGDATGTALTSDGILMDGPKTAIAVYGMEYYLSVQTDFGTASGSGWYAAGSTARASLASTDELIAPGAREHFVGWSGDGSGSGAVSNPISMDGPKTVIATWQQQYFLTIQTAYGTPSGGGWYDPGSVVIAGLNASVIGVGSGARAVFLGWYGAATGSDASASSPITMDRAKTVLASWQLEYQLEVVSAYGQAFGAGWYIAGSSALARVNASTIPTGSGSRVAFVAWSGDATGTATTSHAVLMDGPKVATATWRTEYLVTVESQFAVVEGAGWYAAGSSATLTAPSEVTSDGQTYHFAGWSGDATSTSPSVTFDVSAPRTVRASWTGAGLLAGAGLVTFVSALVILVAIVAVLLIVMIRRRRRKEA